MLHFPFASSAWLGPGFGLLPPCAGRLNFSWGTNTLWVLAPLACRGRGAQGLKESRGFSSLSLPSCQVVAPWRLPEFYQRFPGRRELMDYAKVGAAVG